ncbi:MAG: type III polyketide synthase [Proteobacteria bacterium]|nr:type III polyketide synthase [Pseudomonadota bacterium]
MPSPQVALMAMATAVPPHRLEQAAIASLARRIYARSLARYPQLAGVYVNAGIEQRYSARPLDWFETTHDWPERTRAYLVGARALFLDAAGNALLRAGLRARDVDTIVTVSSTGIATPSLEALVAAEMGFRPDVLRVPVFGRGCAGGVVGLSLGARLAQARPGEVVLVVVVELCTLAFRGDRSTKADVISSALFGDGAAALVLRAGDHGKGVIISDTAEHTWPSTLDIMGWTVDPAGFGVVLSRSLPRFIEQRLAAPVRRFVKRARLAAPQLVLHPGGAKVLEAVEGALALQTGTLRDEREVLRTHGNMSAPTVLFVLERALRRGLRGQALLAAMGPGFTISMAALEGGHG